VFLNSALDWTLMFVFTLRPIYPWIKVSVFVLYEAGEVPEHTWALQRKENFLLFPLIEILPFFQPGS